MQDFYLRSLASMAAEAFKKHEVVPDVLATAPSKTVKAVYDSGVEVNMLFRSLSALGHSGRNSVTSLTWHQPQLDLFRKLSIKKGDCMGSYTSVSH